MLGSSSHVQQNGPRPRRTSLPLDCHRNATNRTRSGIQRVLIIGVLIWLSNFTKSSFVTQKCGTLPHMAMLYLGVSLNKLWTPAHISRTQTLPSSFEGSNLSHPLLLSLTPRCFLLSIATYLWTPQETRAK